MDMQNKGTGLVSGAQGVSSLHTVFRKFHVVKTGQTVYEIAAYYGVSAFVLASCNGLTAEPALGTVLEIPDARGNAYYAQVTDTRSLLCGSDAEYARKNGGCLYPAMLVIL